MYRSKEAAEIISTLEKGGFYAECPCCQEPIPLKKAGLFYRDHFSTEIKELYEKRIAELKERARDLKCRRRSISERSEVGAKAVNIGYISERLAPVLKTFRFERNDCRSLFNPIDYVIFEGLSRHRTVSKIFFTDIKTGGSQLTKVQKIIKTVVEKKQVLWDVYRTETVK